ncbi:hypothetical protein BDV12DRAFT_168446, partial [Aspergillus spectabilis]
MEIGSGSGAPALPSLIRCLANSSARPRRPTRRMGKPFPLRGMRWRNAGIGILPVIQRRYLYLPFNHSEELSDPEV